MALAQLGCVIDVTAFPVAEDEDAWPAATALVRDLDAGLPPEHVTVSLDGGGSLPVADATGRVIEMDIGKPTSWCSTSVAAYAT